MNDSKDIKRKCINGHWMSVYDTNCQTCSLEGQKYWRISKDGTKMFVEGQETLGVKVMVISVADHERIIAEQNRKIEILAQAVSVRLKSVSDQLLELSDSIERTRQKA